MSHYENSLRRSRSWHFKRVLLQWSSLTKNPFRTTSSTEFGNEHWISRYWVGWKTNTQSKYQQLFSELLNKNLTALKKTRIPGIHKPLYRVTSNDMNGFRYLFNKKYTAYKNETYNIRRGIKKRNVWKADATPSTDIGSATVDMAVKWRLNSRKRFVRLNSFSKIWGHYFAFLGCVVSYCHVNSRNPSDYGWSNVTSLACYRIYFFLIFCVR